MKPEAKLWLQLVVAYAVIALALFLSAGTIDYWQAWLFLAVSAVSSGALTLHVARDPTLLAGRTKAGPTAEQRPIQKIIVASLFIPTVATFVVPGLDRRFGWSNAPTWVAIVGEIMIIVSMWMVYRVFRENSYGSATVELAQGQKVVSTGPYAIVRHPMYSSAGIYFVGLSLALGSYWDLIPALLMILGFVWRLFDEEKFLAQNLPGYTGYCAKVRWHLVPGIF